jgi:2-keto-4-pentenoate hydratase/2-oxohepta-3-ene-1,7-dioic acid hydratase in catechol pathway
LKLVTYLHRGVTAIGAVVDGYDLVALADIAPDMLSLIAAGEAALDAARAAVAEGAHSLMLDEVRLLAPIPQPRRNIMCLGKNYAEHAEESQKAWGDKVELPEFPVIFTKATTAVNGPFDDFPYDPAVSTMIDYEAELAFIIGRNGRNISRDEALSYVFGYTVMNDITARDLQRQHKQFFKGKSLDGSAPLGPWIVTADEIADPQNLRITCSVNDELRQEGHTGQMIFDVAETIVQLSRGMTLLAGDIIATGTPSGVGFARTPPVFLEPGDVVVCTVEGVGTIRNGIAAPE